MPITKVQCAVCGKEKKPVEVFSGAVVRPGLVPVIKRLSPEWTPEQNICVTCLNQVRSDFVEQSLIQEKGSLTEAEREVVDSLRTQEIVAIRPEDDVVVETFGDRVADKLAEIGGSWTFIIFFVSVLVIWITLNSYAFFFKPFDPYPYILLNLLLSCLAAFQAPVIMMSQNRQEIKDRHRAEADYKTNLKAELEIRHVHLKLDQLITHQWQRLLEIQQVQLDMLKEQLERTKK